MATMMACRVKRNGAANKSTFNLFLRCPIDLHPLRPTRVGAEIYSRFLGGGLAGNKPLPGTIIYVISRL